MMIGGTESQFIESLHYPLINTPYESAEKPYHKEGYKKVNRPLRVVLLGGVSTLAIQAQGSGGLPTQLPGGQPLSSAGVSPTGVDGSRPVYISGKVLMQDGLPVPQGVTIQRVCSGIAKTVAYTDLNGHF